MRKQESDYRSGTSVFGNDAQPHANSYFAERIISATNRNLLEEVEAGGLGAIYITG
jgi:hypothetical protein